MFATFMLDPNSNLPMFRQLYAEIREAILSGRLKPGTRLPATRSFAEELKVSRNTVLNAFEQLLAEGYLQGKVGSGTYVSASLSEKILPKPGPKPGHVPEISNRGKAWSKTRVAAPRGGKFSISFRPGMPAVDSFPFSAWLRIQSALLKNLPASFYGYGDPGGYRPLREAIAEYLRSSRGVRCEWHQILIVSGSQQALTLSSHMLLDPNDYVWMEDPGYLGARGAFLAAGAKVIPNRIGKEGMEWNPSAGRPRLIYITPSHQFPLGNTMTLSKRLGLLQFAQRSGCWILEDDYDSEFRYSGRPIAALQGLDPAQNVIYLGTFSKVLFPALRLGYMVVPESLEQEFAAAHAILDRHSTLLEQAVLSVFIKEGRFARHIRRMRRIYETRQVALVKAVGKHLQGILEVKPAESGMHIIGWLPEGVSDLDAVRRAAEHGVDVAAVSTYSIKPLQRGGLLLGYASLEPRRIEEGCKLLAKALS